MRAAVVAELGQAPVVGERGKPHRAPGSTLVRVTAAALNPIDLLISGGSHPLGKPQPSHVPGIEGVGQVVESDTLAPGARVRVSVPGGFVDGTLAEYVAAPDAACAPIPDGLADDLAAAIGAVGISALIGLRDVAALRTGESVLVLGATGGFGQAFLHLTKALGAGRVLAAGRNEARLAALGDISDGAVLLEIDPAEFSARLEKVGGPVDVVVDALWGPYAQAALTALRPTGRLLNVGQSAGAQASVDAGTLRHGKLTVLGMSGASLTPEQSAAAYAEVAAYAAAGKLDLAREVYPFEEVGEAWAAQAASPGKKVVLRVSDSTDL
jgi:NADPH:quinone reductase-like Zn-dependent oxidoreductase